MRGSASLIVGVAMMHSWTHAVRWRAVGGRCCTHLNVEDAVALDLVEADRQRTRNLLDLAGRRHAALWRAPALAAPQLARQVKVRRELGAVAQLLRRRQRRADARQQLGGKTCAQTV
jgi:hypothetical protein